jgi:AraC-like DNA-binding protein/quercetin dioxygenase-like cupin family protein
MVRNARFAEYEATPRPVVAIGNEFPAGHVFPPHQHARAQLVYGASGVMMVETEQGRWVVPPDRAVWIPGGMRHNLRMLSDVTTITIWISPPDRRRLPKACHVVEITPLMRSLLAGAIDIVPEYDRKGRDGTLMALLVHELGRLRALPLSLNFPAHARLAERCRTFIKRPQPHDTIDNWSEALDMSRRTFTRLFKAQTGMSFAAWRQQACLFAALPRLAANEPVTQIALDLGYESPAAFATMFKRLQGVPPSQYLAKNQGAIRLSTGRQAVARSRNK